MFLYLEYEFLGIPLVALPYILLTLLVISELSDAFDGYFARKLHQVTDLGKLLDPMADSIYRIAVFLSFTRPPISLPLLLVFVFLYRDSVISTLRTICALRGFALAARATGKIKAILQAFTIFVILILMIPFSLGYLSLGVFRGVSITLTSVAAAYALFAGVEYIFANRDYIAKLLSKNNHD